MKKLLMLAAVASMAFGAWAGESYSYPYHWTVTIGNLPDDYEVPTDLVAYLVNLDDPQMTPSGYTAYMSVTLSDYLQSGKVVRGKTPKLGNYASAEYTFTSSTEISESANLGTVLRASDGSQTVATKYSSTSSGTTLGATAWYHDIPPSGAPEPTSAMLMLLGVAGLALKRKNA